MKKLILLAAAMMVAAGANAQSDDEREFTIRGLIAGLAVGDTLRFMEIGLPDWDLSPAFDVVVAEPDRFEYTGRQPRVKYFQMTCHPANGKAVESLRMGLLMIVDGGTVTVSGTADEMYFSRVDGEAFGEQPLLREATELENAYLRGRSNVDPQKEYRRALELRREFRSRNPSSPWSIVNRMEASSYMPVDSLEAHWARMDEAARESYFGTQLRETIDKLARLLPGQPAPDFSATLPDGRVMNSDEFRGKYLLIYHWSFCPGSLQIEPEVTDLYNRFRDKFNLLGVTDSLEAIRAAARSTSPDEEIFGMKLKPIYESMARTSGST
jgi:hypothetical protein